MERKGQRGSKPKNIPPRDLVPLGSKPSSSVSRSSLENQSQHDKNFGPKHIGSTSGRKDIFPPGSKLAKRPTQRAEFSGNICRSQKQVTEVTEEWEQVAEDVELENLFAFLEAAEERDDVDRIEAYLCGAIKTLRSQRAKLDNILCLTLLIIAKVKPNLYRASPLITEALCSLLKKSDHPAPFKSKNTSALSVFVINILLAVYQEERNWPDIFIKVFIEDSVGDRLWVDNEDCKGFVENILASIKTKMPPKNLLYPELNLNRQDCPSPLTIVDISESDDSLSLECKEMLDVTVVNRYSHLMSEVEESILEAVNHFSLLRHHNMEVATRSFIRFLSTVSGLQEVRKAVLRTYTEKLQTWMQKHQRFATELLMCICMNCNTFSETDQEVCSQIVHFKLKQHNKPLTNQYILCIRELILAHPENIGVVIKQAIYNELSTSRNLNNMAIINVAFQHDSDKASFMLAEVFLTLLRSPDDFLRALRGLLREISRSVRHEINFQKFCFGLMKDQKDSTFRDSFEYKERMFFCISDIIVLSMFLSVTPQIKDLMQLSRREDRDDRNMEPLIKHQESISTIQYDSIHWLHRSVPKYYSPTKEEYIRSVHKILMMASPDIYHHIDNWPPESERQLLFKITCEIPIKQEMIQRLLLFTASKEQYIKPQDLSDLVEKLIRRASSHSQVNMNMLYVTDIKIIDLLLNLCPYTPPENAQLPSGYIVPNMAISNVFWKVWCMLLIITSHNPNVFGGLAWEMYPTLHMMMEMCITNTFVFPPPTMSIGEKGEEMMSEEHLLLNQERQEIFEFESHLAQKTITSQNTLLLNQLISLDPKGPARNPPTHVIEQLKNLNNINKIGNLLCRCRKPDFLLDIIQRQGAPQSMPWLAQLVESSEDAFSVLPVQCLCEFLLSDSIKTEHSNASARYRLIKHLRTMLRQHRVEEGSVQVMEYFFRRLSFQQSESRAQAAKVLNLILSVNDSEEGQFAWLLDHIPEIPSFHLFRILACPALRSACMVETQPAAVSAYIRFLSIYTKNDSLYDMGCLVQDMAQLIVERSTMISAILPSEISTKEESTLNSLFLIFIRYMHKAMESSSDPGSENQDHVRVQWHSARKQAVMNILVVHAMVILLIYGPFAKEEYFLELLNIWFPERHEMPRAFMLDSINEEVLLLPDWLKLKMIRSCVPRLVDAAIKDLEPSQLVLFIQSFGIPVWSMTKLLFLLDVAVLRNKDAVAAAVLDRSHKSYMAQLVEVQHQRGARGGRDFAATLGGKDESEVMTIDHPMPKSFIKSLPSESASVFRFSTYDDIKNVINGCFRDAPPDGQCIDRLRTLQQMISKEVVRLRSDTFHLNHFLTCILQMSNDHRTRFVRELHIKSHLSCPLFRSLFKLKSKQPAVYDRIVVLIKYVVQLSENRVSPLSRILELFCKDTSTTSYNSITIDDLLQTDVTFKKLENSSNNHLEVSIRELVKLAVQQDKISIVLDVFSSLLSKHSKNSSCQERYTLLLDWLQFVDPELKLISWHQTITLLFGIYKPNEFSTQFILTGFTHKANWHTLSSTVLSLLENFEPRLNPSSVLNFVSSVIRIPKLWQGREGRLPKHAEPSKVLCLSPAHISSLTKYILTENDTTLRNRVQLYFSSMLDPKRNLVVVTQELLGNGDEVSLRLVAELYLYKPSIKKQISSKVYSHLAATEQFTSPPDMFLHTLITMLTSPLPGESFIRRMTDIEAALRKIATVHPFLLLRNLRLLACTMQGVSELQLKALQSRNYPTMFVIVLGVLELLQPFIFLKNYSSSLSKILDSYVEIYDKRYINDSDFIRMLSNLCNFILKWVSVSSDADHFICKHYSLIMKLAKMYNVTSVKSLAAISASRGRDSLMESKDLDINSLVRSDYSSELVNSIQVKDLQILINAARTNQDELKVLKRYNDLTINSTDSSLTQFSHCLGDDISNPCREIRLKSWILLPRLLHSKPNLSAEFFSHIMKALHSSDKTVASTAVEHLSEVILYMHEYASELLTAAYLVCLAEDYTLTAALSEALFLLTIASGA